jgi:hypothetical protein
MKTKTLAIFTIALGLVALTTSRAQTTFTRVATGDIVNDTGSGSGFTGAAWCDFKSDGFLDLFVCDYGGVNALYRNNGAGAFSKVTGGDPVQDVDYHAGCAVGDFDNDGFPDLVVGVGVAAPAARHCLLYHNNGDGTFSPVSGGSVTNQSGYFLACAWADYDNDGFLDLVISDTGRNVNGGTNLLFHNNGDGTFAKVTSGPLAKDVGVGWGVLWADYDNDGLMDLLIINIAGFKNALYHNDGNGSFTRILTNSIGSDAWPDGANGAAWGDYDNDGLLDLFVTDRGGNRNRLYHNNGNGGFTNVNSGPMLVPPGGGSSSGCAWGDYDNDGYLDLFVTSYVGRNGLFHNNGDGTFAQVLVGDPVTDGGPGISDKGCSWVDYDNDGFLDLFVTRSGLAPDGNDTVPLSNRLYHNNGNSNAWIVVKLIGTVSNRSAIGARVRARATIGAKTFWQLREINGAGDDHVGPLVAHFGLGHATNVEVLRIEWPSGAVQEFQNVAARQILTIIEPPRLVPGITNAVPVFSLKGGRGFQYELQASADLAAWAPISTVTITNLSGTASIVDTNAPGSAHRFYRAVQR